MTSTWASAATLDRDECTRLLTSARVWRVGMCTPDGPVVLPVNYLYLDGAILFRTQLDSALAAGTQEGTVAFEVDELDDRLQSGWSVLVVGRAEHLQGQEMRDVFGRLDEPWAPGSRPLLARIECSTVTGRRFERQG